MQEIDSILRADLCSFIEKTFYTLNPNVKYLHNWHIEKIAEKLEAAAEGKVRRLVISMPPRYLKSVCVSVAWPAWLLGKDPTRRILVASHSANLSTKHSVDTRKIMQSSWYKKIFPNFEFANDQNEKNKFMSSKFGFRIATSVNASITGEGGNFLIIDDPLSPEQAMCKNTREGVLRWFDQTFSTRLDNKKQGVIVLVMQRLHEDDLAGNLLKRQGWESLTIPVLDEGGNLLHEEREGLDEINKIREDLGEFGFSAQYLQKPILLDGAIIKKAWLKYYDDAPESILAVYQSWDTAIKTGDKSDFSACITIAETANGFYVLDCFKERLQYPDLKRKIAELAAKFNANGVLIEDKASGQSIIQDLRAESKLPIIAINPKDDKITRLARVSPLIEAGKLLLPQLAKWRSELESELFSFPNSKHDDVVDAISQFLNWARGKQGNNPNLRRI